MQARTDILKDAAVANAASTKARRESTAFFLDMAKSLSWLGMDLSWALGIYSASCTCGIVTIVLAFISFTYARSRTERFLSYTFAAWIVMNQAWLFAGMFAPVERLHIPQLLTLPAAILMLVTIGIFLAEKGEGKKDYTAMIGSTAWLAMDVSWILRLYAPTLVFGLIMLASCAWAVKLSENRSVALVNLAFLCWALLVFYELAMDMWAVPAYPCIAFAAVVFVLMLAAMLATKGDLKVLSVFHRVRFSGHMRIVSLVSVMPPSDMDITAERGEDALSLHVTGRIDSMTADRFLKTVYGYADAGNHHILIDAGQVNYISSLGLRVLLQSHRKLASLKGSFKIRSASSAVLQIIFMAGMDSLLDLQK
jgi:anti-sigma B factor antagonist